MIVKNYWKGIPILRVWFDTYTSTSKLFRVTLVHLGVLKIHHLLPRRVARGILPSFNFQSVFHRLLLTPPLLKGFYSMLKSIFSVLLAITVLPSFAAAQQTIDVYIIAGQSNADGRAEVSDLSEAQLASLENDTIIRYVNPGSERERAEPQSTPPDLDVGTDGFTPLVPGGFSVDGTSARQLTQTFGPELSFGASIAEATGSDNQIAIIKVSRGGTNLRFDWMVNPNINTVDDEPRGFLYRALMEHVAAGLAELEEDGSTAIVRGFVWHQGESDSDNVAGYAGLFADFVAGVRDEFGEDIPFVLGELSRDRDNSENFNNNLPNVVASASGLSFISSEGLTTPGSTNPDDDTTHFDANGQLGLGERYAEAVAAVATFNQVVVFDFSVDSNGVEGADPAGSDFDPSVAGDTITIDGLTATIVEVTAPEFDTSGAIPVLTGEITTNATTNISGQRALSVNNLTISSNQFELIGNGTEGGDFNPGESITFTFDQDVEFTSFELESVIAQDSFDILVDGVAVLETTGDDAFIDDLGDLAGLTITAGSEITIAVDGVVDPNGGPSTSVRLESFTVEIIESSTLLGDVNRDGTVDFLDITPFINVLTGGDFQAEADIDQNGEINFLDIVPFIDILTAS